MIRVNIDDDQLLIITPSPNYNGTYQIKLIAYDDNDPYEINTLTDTIVFDVHILPVNDAPILINNFAPITRRHKWLIS